MTQNIRPAFLARLDQDWTDSQRWLSETPGTIIMRLTDALAADDPQELIEWMRASPNIADCVQRLALLAMQQATFNLFEASEKTGDPK